MGGGALQRIPGEEAANRKGAVTVAPDAPGNVSELCIIGPQAMRRSGVLRSSVITGPGGHEEGFII